MQYTMINIGDNLTGVVYQYDHVTPFITYQKFVKTRPVYLYS